MKLYTLYWLLWVSGVFLGVISSEMMNFGKSNQTDGKYMCKLLILTIVWYILWTKLIIVNWAMLTFIVLKKNNKIKWDVANLYQTSDAGKFNMMATTFNALNSVLFSRA